MTALDKVIRDCRNNDLLTPTLLRLAEEELDRLNKVEAERNDFRSKWQWVEGLNESLVKQNDALREFLQDVKETFDLETEDTAIRHWLGKDIELVEKKLERAS